VHKHTFSGTTLLNVLLTLRIFAEHAARLAVCKTLHARSRQVDHGGACNACSARDAAWAWVLQAWPVVALTPPPEELISAASVREARSRVQMVADRLALSGAAVVGTFVSVANGDIVVVDVNCVPDFVPGAPLLQQV